MAHQSKSLFYFSVSRRDNHIVACSRQSRPHRRDEPSSPPSKSSNKGQASLRRAKKDSAPFAAQSISTTSVGLATAGFRRIIRPFGRQWGLHVLLPTATRPPAERARRRLRNPTFSGGNGPGNVGFLNPWLAGGLQRQKPRMQVARETQTAHCRTIGQRNVL